ncbi:MAG: replication initiator protein [Arizlama microvirus]|nr:MAG: replication initiator protein [Arizlama microvirus]
MACYRPFEAYRAPNGGIAFDSKHGYGDQPIKIPCRRCIGCRIGYSEAWAVRCIHESKLHPVNCVVTLTYDDKHLPENGSLRKRDVQLFIKRLRKKISPAKVSYLYCGEYGEQFSRPHYHILLFGYRPSDTRPWRKQKDVQYYRSPTLEKLWSQGNVELGDLTFKAARYVAGYVFKKVYGDFADEHYQRLDSQTGELQQVTPEFINMSTRPAIGKRWFEKFHTDFFPSDHTIIEGKKKPVPSYYLKLLKTREETLANQIKKARIKRNIDRKIIANKTPERLVVRETVIRAKTNLKRDLPS